MRSFVLNRAALANRIALAVLCAVTVWLAGCASSKPAVEPTAQAMVAEEVKLDSLRAKMGVTLVDDKGKEQNLDAVLFSVPGKRYRMELTGPLGIGVASLLWLEDGWQMTFPTEKLYMKGAGYMVGLLGEPSIPTVNIHQIAGFFDGVYVPAGAETVARRDSSGIEIVDAKDPMGLRFTYAKQGDNVLWISRKAPDGKPEVLNFLEYREFEGRLLASRILVERGGEKYLEIRVKKVNRNKSFSPGTWHLTVPRSYKAVGE